MRNLMKITLAAAMSALLASTALAHGEDGNCSHDAESASDHSSHNEAVVKNGDLEFSHARTRAMLAGQKVGGGYVTITNKSDVSDRVLSAKSPNADRMEIHEMSMIDGVMKMRKLDDGLLIPAGSTVELKPGGHHLMFFGLNKPFAEGDKIPVTLTLEKAGEVTLELVTAPAGTKSNEHKAH